MRRVSSVIASVLTAALFLAGCTSDPSAQSPDQQPTNSANSPTNSPSPSPTPTEEPPELVGGGTELFPDKRFVALYGHPNQPAFGALGEQGPEESAERAIELAEMYEAHSEEEVHPAFEIIVTVASESAGADGNYSSVTAPEDIEPFIDVAEEHDVYVVLDLQPGHADFLSQAKIYEDLLKRPNVGLALDPEWRLAEGQVHMQQIGSVSAAEINETTEWLAELTAENDLPQKMVILHQFRHSMIRDREQVNTDHDELAVVLHADGHGTPEDKLETWESLQDGLPEDMHMAWKNFFRQDEPMFSPKQTFEVEPKPWFVSYQ
ncbi:hypothetical protein [Yaniella flava]